MEWQPPLPDYPPPALPPLPADPYPMQDHRTRFLADATTPDTVCR